MRTLSIGAALLLAAALPGCVSAEDYYMQGQGYESAGRYDEAAAAYLGALERDRDYPGARERARATGVRAVEGHLRSADGAESSRDYRTAAGAYRRVDELVARASRVGVQIPLAPNYTQRRREVFDRGIDQVFADATRLGAEGRWEDARNLYLQAVRSSPRMRGSRSC